MILRAFEVLNRDGMSLTLVCEMSYFDFSCKMEGLFCCKEMLLYSNKECRNGSYLDCRSKCFSTGTLLLLEILLVLLQSSLHYLNLLPKLFEQLR